MKLSSRPPKKGPEVKEASPEEMEQAVTEFLNKFPDKLDRGLIVEIINIDGDDWPSVQALQQKHGDRVYKLISEIQLVINNCGTSRDEIIAIILLQLDDMESVYEVEGDDILDQNITDNPAAQAAIQEAMRHSSNGVVIPVSKEHVSPFDNTVVTPIPLAAKTLKIEPVYEILKRFSDDELEELWHDMFEEIEPEADWIVAESTKNLMLKLGSIGKSLDADTMHKIEAFFKNRPERRFTPEELENMNRRLEKEMQNTSNTAPTPQPEAPQIEVVAELSAASTKQKPSPWAAHASPDRLDGTLVSKPQMASNNEDPNFVAEAVVHVIPRQQAIPQQVDSPWASRSEIPEDTDIHRFASSLTAEMKDALQDYLRLDRNDRKKVTEMTARYGPSIMQLDYKVAKLAEKIECSVDELRGALAIVMRGGRVVTDNLRPKKVVIDPSVDPRRQPTVISKVKHEELEQQKRRRGIITRLFGKIK